MSRRRTHERAARTAVDAFWRTVAAGGRPDDQDLQREGFPPETWRAIARAAAVILEHRQAGDFSRARELAREASEALLKDLGEWAPPPPPGPDLDSLDPGQLAAYLTTGRTPTPGPDPEDPGALIAGFPR